MIGMIDLHKTYVSKKTGIKVEILGIFSSKHDTVLKYRPVNDEAILKISTLDFIQLFETEQEYEDNKDARKIIQLENELNDLRGSVENIENKVSEIVDILIR